MLTERSKVPSEPKKRDFFPAKNPVDAHGEVVDDVITMTNKNCNDNRLCEKRDERLNENDIYYSNKENEGRKWGAKLLFCALLATYKGLCALQKA
jgi:hypothetical protein